MKNKCYVLRVDASLEMGTGHVMRCLTLANALHAEGYVCHFICREHPGNLIEFIRQQGHIVHSLSCLPLKTTDQENNQPILAHTTWLGVNQADDAAACEKILTTLKPRWLIVDHYALDYRWEQSLNPYYEKLMVIDDLADRLHQCDLLLDQTFGRQAEDYKPWTPTDCVVLCGSKYALLRPEFAELRNYSLQRRKEPKLQHLLITMGGIDKDNATGLILEALANCSLPRDIQLTVVMGTNAPWLDQVQKQATQMPWLTKVLVNVSNMAQLMADSDLAIGAAGSTSWERCCLGLPTIMVILANNQQKIAQGLGNAGAAYILQDINDILSTLPGIMYQLNLNNKEIANLSQAASKIVNGAGVKVLLSRMIN